MPFLPEEEQRQRRCARWRGRSIKFQNERDIRGSLVPPPHLIVRSVRELGSRMQ